jgi:hypothetical protein
MPTPARLHLTAPPPRHRPPARRELYLNQLGNRPLAAATPDVSKLVAAGLAAGEQLEEASGAAVDEVARLSGDLELIDK